MSGWEPVEFTSERLILKRIHQQAHAEEIHAAIMETIDSVDQWVTWMKPSLTVEGTVAGLQRTCSNVKSFNFRIYKKENPSEMIGACGLIYVEFAPVAKTYEVGYWLKQSHEKNGYVHEACTRLIQYGKDCLHAQRITLTSDKRNLASCRVAEKLGFQCVSETEMEFDARPEWGKVTMVTFERNP